MQSHFVCNGCRSVLLCPRGVTNVCCGVCNTITAFPPPEMARLVCGGCRTLLVFSRVATNVRCTCCNTMNIARPANQVAHVSCGLCHTMLVYPYGAPSVKCAICHYVTNIWIDSTRVAMPAEYRSSESSPAQQPASAIDSTRVAMPAEYRSSEPSPAQQPASAHPPQEKTITVVVENPMSMDETGKLVSNLVVGVAIGKK